MGIADGCQFKNGLLVLLSARLLPFWPCALVYPTLFGLSQEADHVAEASFSLKIGRLRTSLGFPPISRRYSRYIFAIFLLFIPYFARFKLYLNHICGQVVLDTTLNANILCSAGLNFVCDQKIVFNYNSDQLFWPIKHSGFLSNNYKFNQPCLGKDRAMREQPQGKGLFKKILYARPVVHLHAPCLPSWTLIISFLNSTGNKTVTYQ